MNPSDSGFHAEALEALIVEWLSRRSQRQDGGIDPHQPFNDLGIDSLDAITLIGDLETRLGIPIDTGVLFDHPTPCALAQFLASCLSSHWPRISDVQ